MTTTETGLTVSWQDVLWGSGLLAYRLYTNVYYYFVQAKFRNARFDTYAAIVYVNRRITVRSNVFRKYILPMVLSIPVAFLQVLTNIHGDSDWDHCFEVPDVDLPTGYFIGMSAVTGDLAG